MAANTPEEICHLFKQALAQGDLEAALDVYDPEAVFLAQSGETRHGRQGMREVLAPFSGARAVFDYRILQVIQSGDIALMHTEWNISAPQPMFSYAIEVARRQPDGSWRWLIGDPSTVGKHARR